VFDLFGKPVFTSSFKHVHCSRNRAGIPVYGLTADVGYRETRFKSDKGAAYFRQSINATRFQIFREMETPGRRSPSRSSSSSPNGIVSFL
jgi:hypothetical protein